jgi:hypothetical protein
MIMRRSFTLAVSMCRRDTNRTPISVDMIDSGGTLPECGRNTKSGSIENGLDLSEQKAAGLDLVFKESSLDYKNRSTLVVRPAAFLQSRSDPDQPSFPT